MAATSQRFFPPQNEDLADLFGTVLISFYNSAPFIIEYLQRRKFFDENYIPENFTSHIPEHLKQFLAEVIELPNEDVCRASKVALAKRIVLTDLIKYEKRLENILANIVAAPKQYPGINESVLAIYQKRARSIKRFIDSILGMGRQEQNRPERLSLKPLRSH